MVTTYAPGRDFRKMVPLTTQLWLVERLAEIELDVSKMRPQPFGPCSGKPDKPGLWVEN